MQYQKLTTSQRSIKRWRSKRNSLVCRLMRKDSSLTSYEALRMANQLMNQKK